MDMNQNAMTADEAGFPELRSLDELLDAMRGLAEACSTTTEPEQARALFDEGLSMMLEIRVPRMPETEEELAAMLAEARDGPTFTTEEVMERMEASGAAFQTFLGRYRADVEGGVWTSAATRLLPSRTSGGPEWSGGRVVNKVELAEDGSGRTTLTRDGSKVTCAARIGGLSILGAVMLAHVEWHSVWKR
jgi:predicted transcriptional regulator